jgi:hypothetical protein
MARAKASVQDPATQDPEKKPDTEEQEDDGAEGGESGSTDQADQEDAAPPPPRAEAAEAAQPPPAPRPSLIALLEVRSKQALATGQFREHAALDQLVGAAHHLKSKASHALETLTDEDADLVRQLYRAL